MSFLRKLRSQSALEALSTVLTLGLHAALLLVFWVPFRWSLVWLCLASYLLRMWAITAGYHRYFAHRSFKTSRAFQFVLGLMGTTAMQNGPLWWASWHRHHHRHSDQPGDAHSPVQRGLWHAHIGWFLDGSHDHPNLSNVRDLARFPELRFLDRHKWLPIVSYAACMYLWAGFGGLVWGFLVSTLACLQATMCINSLAHVWGSRRFETADDSRNNALLALFTLGEGWHNNHHHDMASARQGRKAWEIDVSYYSLWTLEKLGIIWNLRRPRALDAAGGRRPAARARRVRVA